MNVHHDSAPAWVISSHAVSEETGSSTENRLIVGAAVRKDSSHGCSSNHVGMVVRVAT